MPAIGETGRVIARLEAALDSDPDQLFYSTYVGRGAPRFILSFEGPTAAANVGQIIIQTPDLAARDRLRAKLTGLAATEISGGGYPDQAAGNRPAGRATGAIPAVRPRFCGVGRSEVLN